MSSRTERPPGDDGCAGASGDASPGRLDYWSFVDAAVERTTRALPSVDPRAMRLVLSLHRAANALVYDLESAVHRPRGWSWPGFRVLFVLWLSGPLEAKHVAALSGMSRAAVSALVNTLERDGLVTRRRAGHDRRSVELSLTETGRARFAEAFAAHNEREQTWASALTAEEVDTLTGLLEKLMASPVAAAANRRR
ncbi:MAG TPA: MarR family winged helix-turn-helix transcriptional regulator [Pseudonocardia sp.]|nr:MarR family winged helix-turn-helix transcriptional regulator [Pseudonocardia sp.]